MKVLVVADWHGEIYAQAIYDGFKSLGINTYKFAWKDYFYNYQFTKDNYTLTDKIKSFYYKAQNKFLVGPSIWKLNSDLIKKCEDIKPDLVFIYRGTHIYSSTIRKIKEKSEAKVFGYNNDDPFSFKYKNYVWKHYKESILYYDHVFAYRDKNIKDYKGIGYKDVSILRSYYLKNKNFYIEDLPANKFKSDLVFVGHFEDDGRDLMLKYLIENGIDIKLYGPEWSRSKYYEYFRKHMGEDVRPLGGEDYNLAINSAKIALVFLSKLNNDTYTRRCFEIPATKTMMIAEYTDDLNSMFEQGKEADYFNSKEELLHKVKYYLSNQSILDEVALSGYRRVKEEGHEVRDRCKDIIKVYNNEK